MQKKFKFIQTALLDPFPYILPCHVRCFWHHTQQQHFTSCAQ